MWRVKPRRNVAWPVAVICYIRFRIGGRDFGLATDILRLMMTGWHRPGRDVRRPDFNAAKLTFGAPARELV